MAKQLAKELPAHSVLAEMARNDPAAYESLRRELIDNLIDGAPEHLKPRLRGLQFRIDGVRQCSRTALGSTLKVYSLMWDSFLRLNEEMGVFCGTRRRFTRPRRNAQIIEFRPSRRRSPPPA
jgi:hypothetical protein